LIENKIARLGFQRQKGAPMQNWGLVVVVLGVLVANLPATMAQ